MTEPEPIRVLFVCTGNSARSVMAEALLRQHGGDAFEVHSAGTEPKGINPLTLRVLAEAGIDASWARSKSVDEFRGQSFDYVVTVCDQARQVCPVFPGVHESLHWGYEDPAAAEGSDEERLAVFRKVFIQLGERIRQFATVEALLTAAGDPERPVLAGHDPDFSELLALLCDTENAPMRKGAFARIEADRPLRPGGGTLRWLIAPDALRPAR